jgi:hypothetical protein
LLSRAVVDSAALLDEKFVKKVKHSSYWEDVNLSGYQFYRTFLKISSLSPHNSFDIELFPGESSCYQFG